MTVANDFYEDDEPVEKIAEAFNSGGLGGVTTCPWSTWRADPRCGIDATMSGPFIGTPELGGWPMQRVA